MKNKNTIRFALTISLFMFSPCNLFGMQNINDKDIYGDTQLHRAIQFYRTDIAEALISAGADLNIQNICGDTPLHQAVEYGQENIALALIAAGANLNLQDICGFTPLHLTVRGDQINIVQALIAARADINMQNNMGRTPLHQAVFFDRTNIVRALITAGANTHRLNHAGKNIHQVIQSNAMKTVIAESITERLRQENVHRVEIVMRGKPQLPDELRNDILKFL